MELKSVIAGIDGLKAKGNLDINIETIETDSRKVTKNAMFVAIVGFKTDGHEYIKQAIENGAKAIMIEQGAKINKGDFTEDITIIMAPNTRIAIAKIACNFYKNPSKKLKLIGVTGTKGKTTTTFMIKAILEEHGKKVGLIGTIANYIGDKNLGESSRTTPDSLELQRLFSKMVEEDVEYAIMEVSSQALKLHRIEGCAFEIGVFTNFSEDHISKNEHPDMEDYFNSKLELIKMSKTSYINSDDYRVSKIKRMFPDNDIKTYGIDNEANLIAKDITITNSSVDFKVKIAGKNERIKIGIPGRFSVYNSLAAISVTSKICEDAEKVKNALLNTRVPGRSEIVDNKRGLTIMIDYAHSPESLQSILSAVKSYTRGKVISIFGCGGDRDRTKRPIMGQISTSIADFTIITSDNPRTEDPAEIVKEIEVGAKKSKGEFITIVNRTEAIKHAISIATKNDVIVLAGKGHETYQEINGVKNHYDEREIIKEVI